MALGDRLTDLDYAIMGILPREGSRLGHHTYAKQVISIVEELGGCTSSQVQGRLRSLKLQDMVVTVVVQPTAQGSGWQVTQKGLNVLADRRYGHKQTQNAPEAEIFTLPVMRVGREGA